MVFDDGVTLRLADDHFLMTTTTGGAARVLDWLEEWLQTEWPELDVVLTSVTEHWATVAVVGPTVREVLAKLAPDIDVSNEAFPLHGVPRDDARRRGIPARICRISFSGELAYEINVPGWYGLAVWEDVAAAGAEFGITPYGTETMHVLRAEKGYIIVGQDTDGTITPHDLGMDWVVSKTKDFIGKRSLARTDTRARTASSSSALLPVDRSLRLPEGAQLVEPTPRRLHRRRAAACADPHARPRHLELPQPGARAAASPSPWSRTAATRIGQTLLASFGGRFAEVEVARTRALRQGRSPARWLSR